jgi:hypothetical protein
VNPVAAAGERPWSTEERFATRLVTLDAQRPGPTKLLLFARSVRRTARHAALIGAARGGSGGADVRQAEARGAMLALRAITVVDAVDAQVPREVAELSEADAILVGLAARQTHLVHATAVVGTVRVLEALRAVALAAPADLPLRTIEGVLTSDALDALSFLARGVRRAVSSAKALYARLRRRVADSRSALLVRVTTLRFATAVIVTARTGDGCHDSEREDPPSQLFHTRLLTGSAFGKHPRFLAPGSRDTDAARHDDDPYPYPRGARASRSSACPRL